MPGHDGADGIRRNPTPDFAVLNPGYALALIADDVGEAAADRIDFADVPLRIGLASEKPIDAKAIERPARRNGAHAAGICERLGSAKIDDRISNLTLVRIDDLPVALACSKNESRKKEREKN